MVNAQSPRNFALESLYSRYVAADTAAAFWRGYTSAHAAEREAFYQAEADALYAEYSLGVGDKLAITPEFKEHIRLRFSVRTYDDVLDADYLTVLATDGPDSAVIVADGSRKITTRVPLVLVAKMKRRYQADQKRGLADENLD